ncbi:MAG TPA: helix-turn-helix domain-containing protein [Pyrinomonadaceae bacterium]|nr:helix-turn-helix domain-containing protein [Pyrinomonadaceae bacterium]
MNDEFSKRLQRAFDYASMAEIARRIGVPHATVRNYFGGRLPAPKVLIKIANQTSVSLNWLLTGKGEMLVGVAPKLDLGRIFEERINEIIDRRFAASPSEPVEELGTIDAPPTFDIETAVRNFDDPQRVMNEWFRFEGRDYPEDYGVVFFQGWSSYSSAEKIEAVRDAKKVLDRTLKAK